MHDLNIGGVHHIVTSEHAIPDGARRLGVRVTRWTPDGQPRKGLGLGPNRYTLTIDGEPAGELQTPLGFASLISWSGLDIGRDRGSPVSHYEAPFEFTGRLLRVRVTMQTKRDLDGDHVGNAEMARQ